MFSVYFHKGCGVFRSAIKALLFYFKHSKAEYTTLPYCNFIILPKNIYLSPEDRNQSIKYLY